MTDLTPNDLSHLSDEEFIALCPQGYHAPGPEPLSPGAQEVLAAVSDEYRALVFLEYDDENPFAFEKPVSKIAAAAIRALVDQIAPTKQDYEEASHEFATVFLNGVAYAVNEMRLIATELEGQ